MTDGSICRFERTGDPHARINALNSQGSDAHDYAQCFRPDCISEAGLTASGVVAEVYLPQELDLINVLMICRAIQETGKTHKYNLQTFNCYFFSLALQSSLTRLVAKWEDTITYSDKTWESAISAVHSSLASTDLDLMNQPLFRACSVLRPDPAPHTPQILSHPFLSALRAYFYSSTLQLHITPQDIVDEVFWYQKLGTKLDNFVQEELECAWGRALGCYLGWVQEEYGLGDSPGSDPEPLVPQCVSALQEILKISGARDEQIYTRSRPRRLLSTTFQNSQLGRTSMDYRGIKSDEYEQLKALTISQWLIVLWLHAGQMLVYLSDFFAVLTFGLWAKLSNHSTCVEIELEYIVSCFNYSKSAGPEKLKEFLDKLRALCKKPNLSWREQPWAHARCVVQNNPPCTIELGQESASIKVALEGKEPSPMTISDFQKHILGRIEIQAELVERVWLGRRARISAEIHQMLSLVWTTIRNINDDDTETVSNILSSPNPTLSDHWAYDESTIPTLLVPLSLGNEGVESIREFVSEALKKLDRNVRKVKCSLCEQHASRNGRLWDIKPSNLQRHIMSHLGIKTSICLICDGRFTTRDQLRLHIKKRHEEPNIHNTQPVGEPHS